MRAVLALTLALLVPTIVVAGNAAPKHAAVCVSGFAEGFPCSNVDLYAHISNATLGGGNGNDSWGWTDPDTGKEYALMGQTNGTAFVDISDPAFPIRLGRMPTQSGNSSWRDIKTRGYYAFVVSEADNHGMQVFDLRRLRGVTNPATVYSADAVYSLFGRAHNIAINIDSGFAYAVGSRQGTQTCNAGLHMIDIRNPLLPAFAGCFGADGYTHDVQCVNYQGPDSDYVGREICLASNEDTVTIVDVSNKSAPVQVSRTAYTGSSYTHQGWLTEDARYFLVNDETDEINNGHNTRTYVFNVQNLDLPTMHMVYTAAVASSDHNLYVRGRYAYLANYRSGLRILDLVNLDAQVITEVAFFDTQPASNAAGTSGAWSVYPFFASGTTVVSDISAGLFVLRPVLCSGPSAPSGLVASPAGAQQIALSWNAGTAGSTYELHRAIDGCGGPEAQIATGLSAPSHLDGGVSGTISYGYRVRERSANGVCVSDFSACQAAQTTGACTAPPQFAGLGSAQSAGTAQCAIDLSWPAATPRCSGPVSYRVERSVGTSFDPLQATTVGSAVVGTLVADSSAAAGTDYAYRVRAIDDTNANADGNTISRTARANGPLADGSFASGAEVGDPTFDSNSANPAAPQLDSERAKHHIGWEISNTVARSGQRSFFSTYNNNSCVALTSPTLTLTAGQTSSLGFFTRHAIQAGWDAGLLQISTNGGTTWQIITPIGGYPSAMNNQNSTDACGFANNQPAFTGTNLNWQFYNFNLSAFSGEIKLRWLFSTDGSVTSQGWWIDDIEITHVQVPGICSIDDALFRDGFENP